MATAIESRHLPHFGGPPYDSMRYSAAPLFTNPWISASSSSLPPQSYPTSLPSNQSGLVQHAPTTNTVSMPYPSLPVTLQPLRTGIDLSGGIYGQANSLGAASDISSASRPYPQDYSSSASQSAAYAPTSAPQYGMEYSQSRAYPYQDPTRRLSQPSLLPVNSFGSSAEFDCKRQNSSIEYPRISSEQAQRNSFSDALDASRGMLAMSQVAMSQDMTPRNLYDAQRASHNSTDSYGFPPTHSHHSSISSASTYPYYESSIAGSSTTDYSSASESMESSSRSLPRPSGLLGAPAPPAPQTMMGQFSSKVSSSAQKKHRCKVCDKRFTRPSSLQTHMYSHTGEKPFACDVDGCGRHFSVVSNLRRHKKVHRGERDHPSPDDD